MMMDYDKHVGGRIRMYRKHKGMTAAEFAARIHKGVSAVSKYETGKISMDVNTLAEAAQVLGVELAQLVDIDLKQPGQERAHLNDYLQGQRRFHFYYVHGKKRRILPSILEIDDRGETPQALLFCGVKDDTNAYDCEYLYHGELYVSDANFYVSAENQNNSTEKVFLSVVVPYGTDEEAYGLFSALSPRNRMPVAYKVLFSKVPLAADDDLRRKLFISKEEYADLKEYNGFLIRSDRDE